MRLRRYALLVGVLAAVAGCGGGGGDGLGLALPSDRPPSADPTGMPTDEPTEQPSEQPTDTPTTGGGDGVHTVVYKATADSAGEDNSVTYRINDSEDMDSSHADERGIHFPWTKTVTLQNTDLASMLVTSGTATVTCTITVDGKVVSTETAANAALCNGGGG